MRFLRNRLVVDTYQRLAGHAIEDVEVTGLAGDRDGLARLTFDGEVHQHRGHGVVSIPEVVFDSLVMPEIGTRMRIHRNNRVGEQVVAATSGSIHHWKRI